MDIRTSTENRVKEQAKKKKCLGGWGRGKEMGGEKGEEGRWRRRNIG